jgi:hypothetical protein
VGNSAAVITCLSREIFEFFLEWDRYLKNQWFCLIPSLDVRISSRLSSKILSSASQENAIQRRLYDLAPVNFQTPICYQPPRLGAF